MAFNRYRKRHYSISKTKAREYASEMENISELFSATGKYSDWSISSKLDSCYKDFSEYEIRISNHSADNKYHDIHTGYLIVNIKSSKLDFEEKIDNLVPTLTQKLKELDLEKYRFINVVNNKINCFYRGFKTKKDVFELY